jgi:hypothetical protein
VIRRPPLRRRSGLVRRAMAALLCASFAGVALVGCTSARDTLGTSASTCFEALATAGTAVHHRGTFAGVRLVSFNQFGTDVQLRKEFVTLFGKNVHDVCVVSYRGTFTVGQVEHPLGPAPAGGVGHFAIVVVSKPQNRLLGTVLRPTQPLRFGHLL